MASFNEFQRELQKRNIDPQSAYMFTLIYERLAHMANEIEQTAKAVLAIANTVSGFVQLNEAMEKKLQHVARGMGADGIDVRSVANDPDEDNRH